MIRSILRRTALKAARACAVIAACSSFSAVADDAALRVSAIPDEAPTELQRKFTPLGKYLEAQTGMKVLLTPVADYAAGLIHSIDPAVRQRRGPTQGDVRPARCVRMPLSSPYRTIGSKIVIAAKKHRRRDQRPLPLTALVESSAC